LGAASRRDLTGQRAGIQWCDMIRIADLSGYLSRHDDSIRVVLGRINASPYLFQVVVDSDRRLIGTITDGDVRRAILNGITLDEPAESSVNRQPRVGRVGQDIDNLKMLSLVLSREQFLPIVDDAGRVQEIFVESPDSALSMALVMAGGPGLRLGERTRHVPKPLLEVGGRPILDRVIERLENAGVRRIVIAIHYLSEMIEAFVAGRRNRAAIDFIREPDRLGTAGALGLLQAGQIGSDPLLVVNGDLVTEVDYRALHDFHMRHGNDGSVGVATYNIDVPFGVVRHDADGLFQGVEEKPRLSHFVAAGVYYLSPGLVGLVPKPGPFDMPDLLNLGKKLGMKIRLFPIHEAWADIGRPGDFEAVDAELRRSKA
jgi:dTDP-glucose pyrophosphorylase